MSAVANEKLSVAVVGAGAVGSVIGGRLRHWGCDVAFVARGSTLKALLEHGLTLDTPTGALHLAPVRASDSPAEIGPVDIVLVAVKAEQVPEIAPTLRPMVGPKTCVIPLQNGVEASDQLAAMLGEEHVAEGFCRMLAHKVAPAHVQYGGFAPSIAFGLRAGTTSEAKQTLSSVLSRFAEACTSARLVVENPADVHAALWEKFLFVEPLGAVGAASRATFGPMLSTRETRDLLERCCREIIAVANACGAALGDDAYDRVWALYAGLPSEGTASMQRDLMAGRPSELDAQTGAVVRLGRSHQVPTPAHDFLYSVLKPQEARARSGQ